MLFLKNCKSRATENMDISLKKIQRKQVKYRKLFAKFTKKVLPNENKITNGRYQVLGTAQHQLFTDFTQSTSTHTRVFSFDVTKLRLTEVNI